MLVLASRSPRRGELLRAAGFAFTARTAEVYESLQTDETPTGYVQRLAVIPEFQRRGFGHALLTDGLRWLRGHGARRVFVNTQEDNDGALALYLRSGFTQLPVGLHVLGREL